MWAWRGSLDKALQFELSARQGLPGLNAKAWLKLGAELWMVPPLTFQVLKSLSFAVVTVLKSFSYLEIILISLLEMGLDSRVHCRQQYVSKTHSRHGGARVRAYQSETSCVCNCCSAICWIFL